MKQLKQNFKKLDMFGQEIRLLTTGQPVFKTQFGSCATLILFSMLVYACNTFISDMNQGKNAILNSKEVAISEEDGFMFNSSELIFAVGLLDSHGQPIPNQNRSVFDVSFYFCSKSLEDTNCSYIPSQICGSRISDISQLNIPQVYQDVTYCLDEQYIKNNPIITLQGSTRQDNFTMLGSIVQRCSNSTNSKICSSNDKIDAYLKNANLYYSYSFHSFNKELANSPYERTQNFESTQIYQKVRKYIKMYFQYSYSLLEFNPFYFFPFYKEYRGIEFSNTVIDSSLNFDDDDSSFAQLELNLDAKKVVHQVSYQTLMDVAAKIGGLFTIIRVFLDICLYPIQYILYRIYLINVVIKHKNAINNQSEMVKSQKELTILSIFKSSESRQLYFEQSQIIEQLLDIAEILINPLRITRQVEDLYGSLRRFDVVGCKQANININQEIEESVSNNEFVDQRSLSARTINQEINFGTSTNIKIRASQFKKK